MLFEGLLLRVGRHRMEVEIERGATREASPLHLPKPGAHQLQVGLVVDAGAVGGQVGPFGNDVESSEKGHALVKDQVHHVTLAFLADELERQQRPHRLLGGDPGGPWQGDLPKHSPQSNVSHQRDEQEETPDSGSEGPGRQIEDADVCSGSGFGFQGDKPFVIATAREACKALLSQQDSQGVDADRVAGARQFPLDVIDREVLLPHRHGECSDTIARRGFLRSARDVLEEPGLFGWIMPKLVTQDAKGARRVAEALGHLVGRHAFNEEAAKGFILSVERLFGGEKEVGFEGLRYSISSIGHHEYIMLSPWAVCQ